MTLAPGTRLGPYEVLARLGAGGMGEVFRARDTRLGREVALKVLPAEVSSDADRLRRFEQEARTASALNHPNIVTIHDVGSVDGTAYLAMELVGGQTLREFLAAGALPPKRLLPIASQMGDGLARAHAAGIVHRDLKPENVMVTGDGLVKLLDFGLAKTALSGTGAASTLSTIADGTAPGTILGTVAYMSPEQASGQSVDFRSDQFSLGVILYEMAAGRRAFARGTAVETLTAILREEPEPLATVNPGVPAPLRWIVERCLAKEPRGRYASTEDLARDLATLRDRLPETTLSAASLSGAAVAAPRRSVWLTLAAGIAVLIPLAFALGRRSAPSLPGVASTAALTQLTNGRSEKAGAISPDGKTFAFVSEKGGGPDIWVRQVAGGDPVQITHDADLESDIVYSPEGESIYFTRWSGGKPAIWRVAALGGTARKVLEGTFAPAPSPDGRELAFLTRSGNDMKICLARVDGTGVRTIHEGGFWLERVSWSPDGKWLAFTEANLFETRNLEVVDLARKSRRKVTRFTSGWIDSQAWLADSRRLVFARKTLTPLSESADLWIASLSGGEPRRLTINLNSRLSSPSLSADGKRLVATMETLELETWKVPLGPDPEANGRAAVKLLDSSWTPFWNQVSRDGRTLLFNSSSSGSRNLWTLALGGTAAPRQLTFLSGGVTHSSLSPDGKRVAYASQETGNSEIFTANADGSSPLRLTNDPAPDFWPSWSPDGRWIVFGSTRTGTPQLWKVSSAGGPAVRVTKNGGIRGDWSPLDTRIVYAATEGRIELADASTGAVLRGWDGPFGVALPVFSPDGRSFSAVRTEGDRSSVWIFDAETGEGRPAVRFPERFHLAFRASWCDGGKALTVDRIEAASHIVLLENF